MLRLCPYLLIILFAVQGNIICHGQQTAHTNVHDSLSAEMVIFEDDFSKDVIGQFPSNWRLSEHDAKFDSGNKKYFTVQKEKNTYSLSVKQDIGLLIEPDIKFDNFHTDSLNIDFDFLFENYTALISLNFCSRLSNQYCNEVIFFISNKKDEGISLESFCWENKYFKGKKTGLPVPSFARAWHHFRITFYEGTIKCYLDQYRLLSMPETGYFPGYFMIGLHGALKFTKFRLTSVKNSYSFDKIITENRFVTHAILFDVNQSTIKPESMEFITQLTEFLKANPTVKIEIDGHTDSDGDAAANMKLSQARADEVKKQLAAMGIDAKRLTTKGFGDTKPIQPNITPEAKANNRRVEFIRQ